MCCCAQCVYAGKPAGKKKGGKKGKKEGGKKAAGDKKAKGDGKKGVKKGKKAKDPTVRCLAGHTDDVKTYFAHGSRSHCRSRCFGNQSF